MFTKLGIVWVIIELLIGCQMMYCAFMSTGKAYAIITTLYWVLLIIYTWNPSNIFYINNKEN